MNLSELQNGRSAEVVEIKGGGEFRTRLTEMGFVRGTSVKAIKRAPLGDPVEYQLMGYRISLRRAEAAMIEMK